MSDRDLRFASFICLKGDIPFASRMIGTLNRSTSSFPVTSESLGSWSGSRRDFNWSTDLRTEEDKSSSSVATDLRMHKWITASCDQPVLSVNNETMCNRFDILLANTFLLKSIDIENPNINLIIYKNGEKG